jgi:hypothetical protein
VDHDDREDVRRRVADDEEIDPEAPFLHPPEAHRRCGA